VRDRHLAAKAQKHTAKICGNEGVRTVRSTVSEAKSSMKISENVKFRSPVKNRGINSSDKDEMM
jgi:hypothetical protein